MIHDHKEWLHVRPADREGEGFAPGGFVHAADAEAERAAERHSRLLCAPSTPVGPLGIRVWG